MSNQPGAVSKKNLQNIYPLLPMQEGMLFHALYEPKSWAYFEQTAYRLRGDFEAKRCEAAWKFLSERHEILRSAFVHEGASQPLHLILKERSAEFAYKDLRSLDAKAQQDFLKNYKEEDRNRGFDLRHDVLMRISILQLGDSLYEMIWSHPHILIDGWSGGILQAEFLEIYQALKENRPPHLLEPVSCGEYLDWIESRDREAARAYWRDYLSGYESLASPLGANAAKRKEGYAVEEYDFRLDAETSAALNRLAAQNGATLNTAMQCLWGVLLSRYNGADDVVFGAVASGRPADVNGVERLVGLFINTIPVRIRLHDDLSFMDLMKQIQIASTESAPYDFFPFAEIQAESPLKHGLLDHLLVFENYPIDSKLQEITEDSGLGFKVEGIRTFEQVHYNFGLLVHPGAEIEIKFNYNGNAYSRRQVERMAGHLRAIASGVICGGGIPLKLLGILAETEKRRILYDFNSPTVPISEEKTLIDLWEEQAEKTPDHVAVFFQEIRLTYRELNERANRIAHYLRQHYSIQPDDRIGVFLERSDWAIAALLGAMKAGGAYTPIDPAYPEARIQFILQDCGCRVALADAASTKRIEAILPGLSLNIQTIADGPSENPSKFCASRHLAYVIYTSGSTGTPKGVMVEHRGFVNMILEQIRGFGVTPQDRVLQFASCSFDASLSEIFMALLSGAALILASEETIRDGHALRAYMMRHGATVVTFPPSYLRALEQADFPGLRVMITAGEAAYAEDALHYAKNLRYFNAYGPTEATVCAAYQEIKPGDSFPGAIPIGKPIVNTRIRILDRALQPLPIGAPGEICLAGAGLARGYLNRPEQTDEKFIPSPFQEDGRLYRTGDIGRWLEDGSIEFLGREDDQMKIHGCRIELGEIENRLRAYPGVQQTTVIALAGKDGTQELAAYFSAGNECDSLELRRHLFSVLPFYMVPKYIVRLDELPLTPNRKIDKKSLPSPQSKSGGDNYVPPKTKMEIEIARVWQEALGKDKVGVHDSFFDLGGDSIKAIQVASRLHKAGIRLSLRDLFEWKTIAGLCKKLNHNQRSAVHETAAGIVELTPIQRWFFEEHSTNLHHFNHTVWLWAKDRLPEEALRTALQAIQNHHDALRMRYRFTPSGVIQKMAGDPLPIQFSVMDFRRENDGAQAMIRHAACLQDGFDLKTGPLMKSVLYRLKTNDYLLLTVHHLAVDAVSWRFLLEDLTDSLKQAMNGVAPVLPVKTASYQQWSEALRQYSVRTDLLAQKSYWMEVDSADAVSIPRDFPESENRYGDVKSMRLELSLDDADRLQQTASLNQNADAIAILLTALARALNRWRPGKRFRIALTGHGREEIEKGLDISRTVGWFTSHYPVLLDLPIKKDIEEQLIFIQKMLQSIPDKGIGYGVLKYLTPETLEKEICFFPPPDILFNYMGRVDGLFQNNGVFTLAEEFDAASIAPELERRHLLEMDGMTLHNSLIFHVGYNRKIHRRETIERFLGEFENELKTLAHIEHSFIER
ncbi:MAG: amino acid adenylation domain-containing protein [Candidatus Omnitrophota bacterium]